MQQIERGIYYETGYLGVTLGGLVNSHGTILIDAPLRPEDARSWRSSLMNQRGGTNRLLVNLDAHPDRTLGSRALDCTIIAHQKTAQVFRNRPTIFKGQTTETGAVWESYGDAIGMRWATPDITFTQRVSLHWGGPEVVLEHHPSATPGSTWVIIPAAKVAFVGDSVVIDQTPFLAHADLHAWNEELELLLTTYKDYTIISGRGGVAGQDAVLRMQHNLKNVVKGIEKLAKRTSAPEATEELIQSLLVDFDIPAENRERSTQRLRYGLYHYYSRKYRPTSAMEPPRLDDSEQ